MAMSCDRLSPQPSLSSFEQVVWREEWCSMAEGLADDFKAAVNAIVRQTQLASQILLTT